MERSNKNKEYISVKEWAEIHGVPERTVRNYCAQGKFEGAYLVGKTWNIPADAEVVPRKAKSHKISPLLCALREQMASKVKGAYITAYKLSLPTILTILKGVA